MYGYSDDLVEVEGVSQALDRSDLLEVGECDVSASDNGGEYPVLLDENCGIAVFRFVGLLIKARWNGIWSFEVTFNTEDDEFPSYPIRLIRSDECSYSMELQIDTPELTPIVRIS